MIDLSLDHRVFVKNELDAALQELDILFNTTNTELIGYPSFGTDFEQFLWQMTPATESIKNYIQEKMIDTLFLRKMHTDVFVEMYKGEYRMIYNVTIIVTDRSGNQSNRKYQFR